jgi:pilus assembly protein Flp/PilA
MFSYSINAVRAISTDKKGAALVEYGMLVGLIAVICVAAVGILGGQVNAMFTAITAAL